jgi:hypothetical protein
MTWQSNDVWEMVLQFPKIERVIHVPLKTWIWRLPVPQPLYYSKLGFGEIVIRDIVIDVYATRSGDKYKFGYDPELKLLVVADGK